MQEEVDGRFDALDTFDEEHPIRGHVEAKVEVESLEVVDRTNQVDERWDSLGLDEVGLGRNWAEVVDGC